jgi:hypothetical protein
MVLHGKLAVGTLDFLLHARPRDPKHFVIIAFTVARQNSNLPVGDNLANLSLAF